MNNDHLYRSHRTSHFIFFFLLPEIKTNWKRKCWNSALINGRFFSTLNADVYTSRDLHVLFNRASNLAGSIMRESELWNSQLVVKGGGFWLGSSTQLAASKTRWQKISEGRGWKQSENNNKDSVRPSEIIIGKVNLFSVTVLTRAASRHFESLDTYKLKSSRRFSHERT